MSVFVCQTAFRNDIFTIFVIRIVILSSSLQPVISSERSESRNLMHYDIS